MINKHTINQIFEAIDIVEVIGEFVTLKKRGANYVGLSPFANERTPSFTVSPSKQIFKDFSSGKGGNAVTFLMEHERFSYPDALRWLAKKYNITIEEEIKDTSVENNDRESIFVINDYAANVFTNNLLNNEEGKIVGLSYFKERGFRTETISKFQLGYCLNSWNDFTSKALEKGYEEQFLVGSGLTIKKEDGRTFDRYKGRVIFPIHNLSGRIIGFGGRVLQTVDKVAKYINSPESIVYNKSQSLYGIYWAKQRIKAEDNCYLVEGYTDVISLNQSGIENVVASSGTSLTTDQIKLIKRFTNNVTILYDGDIAGIKASIRGIDMLIEGELNVKIVLFPDGHDPDSYVKLVGAEGVRDYIAKSQQDFITYKSNFLLSEAGSDPVKKATAIKDIIETISKISDGIQASIYVSEASKLLKIEERVINLELNKIYLRKNEERAKKESRAADNIEYNINENFPFDANVVEKEAYKESLVKENYQEREIIRILINYGSEILSEDITVAEFILAELEEVEFEHPLYLKIFNEVKLLTLNGQKIEVSNFSNHEDPEISSLVADLIFQQFEVSENWRTKMEVEVVHEHDKMNSFVLNSIYHIKIRKADELLLKNIDRMKTASEQEQIDIIIENINITKYKQLLAEKIGAVIIK